MGPRLIPARRECPSQDALDLGDRVRLALADEPLDHLLPGDRPSGGRDRRDVDVDRQPLAVDQNAVTVEDHQPVLREIRWMRHPHNLTGAFCQAGSVSAALVPDPEGRGGMNVLLDGMPQSYVDLADPSHLAFEYVRLFGCVLDALAPGPLRVTHIGGGGLTLARYVHATRPGSPQIVLEPDAELTALVRERLPLPRGARVRVRPVDGRTGVAALADASADVVVLDAYAGGRVPPELTTVELLTDVARAVGDGVFLANLADEKDRGYLRRAVAGAEAVFGNVLLIAPSEVLKGRRFGNTVVVASRSPMDADGIRRQVARAPFPAGVRGGPEVGALTRSRRPWTDADNSPSPQPPPLDGTWRVR